MAGSIVELRWNTGQTGLEIEVRTEADAAVTGYGSLALTEEAGSPGFYRAADPASAVGTTGIYRVLIKSGSTTYDTQYVYLVSTDASTVRYAENSRALVELRLPPKGLPYLLVFPMTLGGSGVTGLTVSGAVSKDGGATASLTNSVSEIGSGLYSVTLTASEMAADSVAVRLTATGADDQYLTIVTN